MHEKTGFYSSFQRNFFSLAGFLKATSNVAFYSFRANLSAGCTCQNWIKIVQDIDNEVALQRAVEGDSEAFGELYELYIDRIFNYVYYRTGNVYDAEDLTERVFLRALRHIGNYNDRGLPFSAWLYRIAHNLVANWHRDNSRRKEYPLNDGVYAPQQNDHPEHELMRAEEQEHLLKVIRCLPPERQQLLILKFVDHLSNSEIGEIMGRTEGAVKSLYHRTLLAIRDEYGSLPLDKINFIRRNGGNR